MAGAFPGVIPKNISDEMIFGFPLVLSGGNRRRIMGKNAGRKSGLILVRNSGGIFDCIPVGESA